MELQESTFIRPVHLKSMVHDVKIEKTIKKNCIRDELRTFPTLWMFSFRRMISAQSIYLKYTILLRVRCFLFLWAKHTKK